MAAKKSPAPNKKPKIRKTLHGQESVKFVLRLSPKTHAKIKTEAKNKYQSMNEYMNEALGAAVRPKNQVLTRLKSLQQILEDLIEKLKNKGVI